MIGERRQLAGYFLFLGFKRGAEIGVAKGDYSQILLDTIPDLELYLIDPWQWWCEGYSDPENAQQEEQDKRYEDVKQRFAGKNVVILRKTSMQAATILGDNFLDFVYIDANHSYDWVMADMLVWWRKIRSGGILSGHDFDHQGVNEAVRDFASNQKCEFNLADNKIDWWIRKETE